MSEQAIYDAFGWNAVRGLPLDETHGLDYESAREATPRWYGASFGDGNNGVSHIFADYYVRTADPWLLAGAAIVARFEPEYKAEAIGAADIDGEADYTISACIYNPLDDDSPKFNNHYSCECGATHETEAQTDDEIWCCECGEDVEPDSSDELESWCDVNGAWLICEVFPEDDMRDSVPQHDSITECFLASDIKLAKESLPCLTIR
jgi:hypothetical protein